MNRTGNEFYYVWAVTPGDSFPNWPMSIPADSLKLNILKDEVNANLVLPSSYKSTDRVTLRMYILDTTGSSRIYRFRLESTATIGHLAADSWNPWIIESLSIPPEKALKMEDLKRLLKSPGKQPASDTAGNHKETP